MSQLPGDPRVASAKPLPSLGLSFPRYKTCWFLRFFPDCCSPERFLTFPKPHGRFLGCATDPRVGQRSLSGPKLTHERQHLGICQDQLNSRGFLLSSYTGQRLGSNSRRSPACLHWKLCPAVCLGMLRWAEADLALAAPAQGGIRHSHQAVNWRQRPPQQFREGLSKQCIQSCRN